MKQIINAKVGVRFVCLAMTKNLASNILKKKQPLKLAIFANYVYKDLKTVAEFDETIIFLWNNNMVYKGRDYSEGTQWQVSLDEIIEFRFNRKFSF